MRHVLLVIALIGSLYVLYQFSIKLRAHVLILETENVLMQDAEQS